MTGINGILSRGEVVRNRLRQMLSEKEYTSEDINNLLSAYTSIALEHHESIYLLINRELYGSAFALVRPLFDTFFRAHWVCRCATKEQVQEIYNNDSFQFPRMDDMAQNIDEKYASEEFFSIVKRNFWSSMCSYTHTGLLQIGRRFTGNIIKPNYSDGAILEVLKLANVFIILATRLFFETIKQIPEVKEIEKMILEL